METLQKINLDNYLIITFLCSSCTIMSCNFKKNHVKKNTYTFISITKLQFKGVIFGGRKALFNVFFIQTY